MESQKPEFKTPSPEVEALPVERGAGEGAEGRPSAGGAPKVKCEEFEYRSNIRTPGRTLYVLIDTSKWEIVRPTRKERSKTGAHGKDVYCLSEEMWSRVVVVRLARSNSGKLKYWAGSDNPQLRDTVAKELEEVLRTASSFEDMVETVEKYVEAKYLASIFGQGG
jgi:hypothetical protein